MKTARYYAERLFAREMHNPPATLEELERLFAEAQSDALRHAAMLAGGKPASAALTTDRHRLAAQLRVDAAALRAQLNAISAERDALHEQGRVVAVSLRQALQDLTDLKRIGQSIAEERDALAMAHDRLASELRDEQERHQATLKLLNTADADFAKVMDERDTARAALAHYAAIADHYTCALQRETMQSALDACRHALLAAQPVVLLRLLDAKTSDPLPASIPSANALRLIDQALALASSLHLEP